jgi:hypothetical protein
MNREDKMVCKESGQIKKLIDVRNGTRSSTSTNEAFDRQQMLFWLIDGFGVIH